MIAKGEIPEVRSRSRGKISPWITTALIVVYTVIIQVMLITSMEEAFSFVEDFLEKMTSSIWYIGIPIPLIVALFFYFYGHQDKETNLKLFIFSSTALGFMIISIVLYFIIDPILFPSSRTNFVYFSISATCSLLLAFLSLIVKKIIAKRKSLQ